jgi:hypothetical protein
MEPAKEEHGQEPHDPSIALDEDSSKVCFKSGLSMRRWSGIVSSWGMHTQLVLAMRRPSSCIWGTLFFSPLGT